MIETIAHQSEEAEPTKPLRPLGPASLADLEAIVLRAFTKAAQQDKHEWYRMHGTVLKNRLLDLTERTFDEKDYGAPHFLGFVRLLDSVLAADLSVRPYVVELLEPYRSQIGASAAHAYGQRIRSDLWRAVVDYSSPGDWLWSPAARTVVNTDTDSIGDDCVPLPTLGPKLLGQWRAEFADEHLDDLADGERRQVQEWLTQGLRASALPKHLHGRWNALLRERVEQRLVSFFDEQGLAPPPDLLSLAEPRRGDEELRAFVTRCVGLMSEADLKELPIPAHVAMRARR